MVSNDGQNVFIGGFLGGVDQSVFNVEVPIALNSALGEGRYKWIGNSFIEWRPNTPQETLTAEIATNSYTSGNSRFGQLLADPSNYRSWNSRLNTSSGTSGSTYINKSAGNYGSITTGRFWLTANNKSVGVFGLMSSDRYFFNWCGQLENPSNADSFLNYVTILKLARNSNTFSKAVFGVNGDFKSLSEANYEHTPIEGEPQLNTQLYLLDNNAQSFARGYCNNLIKSKITNLEIGRVYKVKHALPNGNLGGSDKFVCVGRLDKISNNDRQGDFVLMRTA
jgi:hypothetical protein